MKVKKVLLPVFLLTLLSSCSVNTPSSNITKKTSTPTIASTNSTPKSSTAIENLEDIKPQNEVEFSSFFDIQNAISTEINISSIELQKLNRDYLNYKNKGLKSPIYRLADSVTIAINIANQEYKYVYYNVGVKMKGNTSRHEFIDKDSNIYDNIHFKLSFEETFDDPNYYSENEYNISNELKEKYKNRKFIDMSKLDLRYNKNKDQSYIKEYYALSMYRDFGILAPHCTFSSLTINQDGNNKINYGVYYVEEPLNKSFIKRSLSSKDTYIGMSNYSEEKMGKYGVSNSKYGQLYKASYGVGNITGAPDMTRNDSSLFGVENIDSSVPPYELKSNTDNPDHTLITNMINTLNNGTYQDIANVIDLDYFYMYEAVASVLGDPDDLRNDYNNYGLYFRKTDGKMVIIPIDKDRELGVSMDYDPSGNAMSLVSVFSSQTSAGKQLNNLYNKTLLADGKSSFVDSLKTVINSKWVTNEYFNSIYEIVKNHYEDVTKDALCNVSFSLNETYNGSKGNKSFSTYIKEKLNTINNDLKNYNNELNNPDSNNIIYGSSEFYLTGTMDNWSMTSSDYRFTKIDDNKYSYSMIIPNNFECKIYCNDKKIWLRADNDSYLREDGSNMKFNDVGKTIIFIIDTFTGKLSYTIS